MITSYAVAEAITVPLTGWLAGVSGLLHVMAAHAHGSDVVWVRDLCRAVVEEGLRLLIQTRGQGLVRGLRGKVAWEGDLEQSRRGRATK